MGNFFFFLKIGLTCGYLCGDLSPDGEIEQHHSLGSHSGTYKSREGELSKRQADIHISLFQSPWCVMAVSRPSNDRPELGTVR